MVTLNFTLLVELILFLVFLWGANVLIIRPALRTLDERDAYIAEAESRAQAETAVAMSEEARYAGEIAKLRRQTEERINAARRRALDERTATLLARRKESDAAVMEAHTDARQQVKAERAKLDALAPDLAAVIAKRLHITGTHS